jgi:hypothetical protein
MKFRSVVAPFALLAVSSFSPTSFAESTQGGPPPEEIPVITVYAMNPSYASLSYLSLINGSSSLNTTAPNQALAGWSTGKVAPFLANWIDQYAKLTGGYKNGALRVTYPLWDTIVETNVGLDGNTWHLGLYGDFSAPADSPTATSYYIWYTNPNIAGGAAQGGHGGFVN